MAEPIWIFDPVTEDAGNSQLTVSTGDYGVRSFSAPMAPQDLVYASSVDTEGERAASRRSRNRTIQMGIDVETAESLSALEFKVAKLARDGGTLSYVTKGGESIVWDIVTVQEFDFPTDDQWLLGDVASVSVTLEAGSFGRGPEQDLGDNSETSLPALIFSASGVLGSATGKGRLLIDNDAASDAWTTIWAVEQNRYYAFTDSTGASALFYQAESRTAMGGSSTVAGPTGASGSGSNVMRNTALTSSYLAIMSTQASGGGAHLGHVGEYHVMVRVQVPATNTGTVTVALEWGEGDFRSFTRNDSDARSIDPGLEANWLLLDLGKVNLTKVVSGTQRWEGRIIAKSTVPNDDIDLDCMFLFPVDDGYGVANGVARTAAPSSLSARDEFDQTAGNLTGKTLPTGGTWTFGNGDTDDYTLDTTNHWAQRVSVSDTDARVVYASTPTLTNLGATIDFKHALASANGVAAYVIFRWVDANNFGYVTVFPSAGSATDTRIALGKLVGGVGSTLDFANVAPYFGDWATIRVAAFATGEIITSLTGPTGATGTTLHGVDPAFATGGALASGKVGFADIQSGTNATARAYDNFTAWVPPADAAVFAGQSLEIRSDRVVREDSGGTLWQKPSKYEGDYLRVRPAGSEGRTTRMIVKTSGPRFDTGIYIDSSIPDVSARLFVTPRYPTIPEP